MAHIVKQVGKPKRFRNQAGQWVEAKDKIWVKEYSGFIPVTWYDNHSIYETGLTEVGTMPYLCTCGGPAVIIGPDLYTGKSKGLMFICLIHAQTGKHADGSS